MWNKRFLEVIPSVVFLFCILEIFELVLIIDDMNKTERLETAIMNNLKVLEDITRHLKGMQLEHSEYKR